MYEGFLAVYPEHHEYARDYITDFMVANKDKIVWKSIYDGDVSGRRLFGGGVGDLGGRCRARAGGWGMWGVEGGGGWGSGVDYLPE